MKEQIREEPKIVAAAERQMRAWELAHTVVGDDPSARKADRRPRLGPFVAISREHGAGGSEIANVVGRRLGWEVFDKNLLESVANRCHTSPDLLELVDETAANWVYDVLGTWLDRVLIPHEKYVTQLYQVVLAAARRGKAVFVGRGAPFVLPREGGLTVRVYAPMDYRVEQVAAAEGLSSAEARERIQQIDKGRRLFVQRYFHQAIDDPHVYDLLINVARLGREGAVEQILVALRHQGLMEGTPPA